jgi:hypothetical protein
LLDRIRQGHNRHSGKRKKIASDPSAQSVFLPIDRMLPDYPELHDADHALSSCGRWCARSAERAAHDDAGNPASASAASSARISCIRILVPRVAVILPLQRLR